ncbi:hypothetical protein [Novosphingobium sp. PASSN1]|uniref:hypothetical protein n=1 Tax=Novosphingobium sp. PASSN1 TaxID=2015561 RepID=UPI0025F9DD2E|nr:hypothetical protein [Novosphingobium sp. PASSN1]
MKRFVVASVIMALMGCDNAPQETGSTCTSEMNLIHKRYVCDAYEGLAENPEISINLDLLTQTANKYANSEYRFTGGSCARYVPMTTGEAENFLKQC